MEKPSPSLIVVDLTLENAEIAGLMAGGEGKLSSVKVVNVYFWNKIVYIIQLCYIAILIAQNTFT